MANTRTITKVGDPILREKAVQVRRFNETLANLLDDMAQTMYENEGIGLAAPQIGICKQLIVVDEGEGKGLFEMVNPKIISAEGNASAIEYCLSVPGRGGRVTRATSITVEAQDRYGKVFNVEAEGNLARVFQHEIDHLQGILFIDVMTEEVDD